MTMANRNGKAKHSLEPEKALAGILALLVEEREERKKTEKDAKKTELVLSQAGLSNEDIALVTGKQADAVRMKITRAKSGKRSE